MKRAILFALTAALIIGVCSCGGQNLENELRPILKQDAAVENHNREKSEHTRIDSEEQDYSGYYADTQGTADVYSELELVYQGSGSYKASIGLYRLTTFRGTAIASGETLLFKSDSDMQVKGEISIRNQGATFTIIESDFTYTAPGDVFQFPIKIADMKPGYSIEDAGTFDGELYSGTVFFLRSETDESDMYWQIPVFVCGQYLTTLEILSDEHGAAFPRASQLVTQTDVDFDGQADLLLGLGHFGAQGAVAYKCWLTRDDMLIYCPSFSDIPNPALDSERKEVLGQWRNMAVSHGYGIYRFVDDSFVMLERLTEQPANMDVPTDAILWSWTDEIYVDGTWQVREYFTVDDYDKDTLYSEKVYGDTAYWDIGSERWRSLYNNGKMSDFSIYG